MLFEGIILDMKDFKECSKFTKISFFIFALVIGVFMLLQISVDVLLFVFMFGRINEKPVVNSCQCLKSGDFIVNGPNYVSGMSFADLGTVNSSIQFILQNGNSIVNSSIVPPLKIIYISDGVYKIGIGNNDPTGTLDVTGDIISEVLKSNSIQPKSGDNFTIKANVLNIESSSGIPSSIEMNLPGGIPWNINGGIKLNSGNEIQIFFDGQFTVNFTDGFTGSHNVTYYYLKVNNFVSLSTNSYFSFSDYDGSALVSNPLSPIPDFLRPATTETLLTQIFFINPRLLGYGELDSDGIFYFSRDFFNTSATWPVGVAQFKPLSISYYVA